MSKELPLSRPASASSSIVTRSAKVLDVVCDSAAALTFMQVVARSGLPKSSVHRLLSILLGEDLVTFDRNRQTYGPGPRLIGWAARAFRANNLPDLAAGDMESLSARTGAHTALSVLDGVNVLYLKTVEAGQPFRLAPRVGERSPVHACAAGKAIVAFLPPARQAVVLHSLEFEQCTEKTVLTRSNFETALGSVLADGYATCDREEFLQVVGIASPVFDANGDVVAAISLWNTTDRQDINELLSKSGVLLTAAASVSARLGFETEPQSRLGKS